MGVVYRAQDSTLGRQADRTRRPAAWNWSTANRCAPNRLMRADGYLKILTFGLAKLKD